MNLEHIRTWSVENAQAKQYHRIVLLNSGTIVGLYSESGTCYLQWISGDENVAIKIDEIEDDPFATPALFHFGEYAGIYSSKKDFVVLYHENEKTKQIQVPIENTLPQKKFPNFSRPLLNYTRAGNTDSNIIPVLFVDGSLLPVYIAQLQIEPDNLSAKWINLHYWENKKPIQLEAETFERSSKAFAILHAVQKKDTLFAFGIGHNDAGYLKPGMECSDLVTLTETGAVNETLFTLGKLHKESKKGGKECIFSSSGKYAILTPAFKSDDWKNKQKLFDLETRELIDLKLPKELSDLRIIDHNNDYFLLADNYINLVFANVGRLVICNQCQ